MPVTIKEVEHIANLARLEFSGKEMETFTHQLNDILTYVDKLNEIDTTHIEPLSNVFELSNVFRDDEVKPSLPIDEVLKNAPSKKDSFFKVPKVIG